MQRFNYIFLVEVAHLPEVGNGKMSLVSARRHRIRVPVLEIGSSWFYQHSYRELTRSDPHCRSQTTQFTTAVEDHNQIVFARSLSSIFIVSILYSYRGLLETLETFVVQATPIFSGNHISVKSWRTHGIEWYSIHSGSLLNFVTRKNSVTWPRKKDSHLD